MAWFAVIVGQLTLAVPVVGQEPLSFRGDVWPILRDRCVRCHGVDRQDGGLRLDSRSALESGGDSGENLLQLPADENQLLRRITTSDENQLMPLGGPRLSDAKVRKIRLWLEQGADWPDLAGPGERERPGTFESLSIQLREWTRFNKISLSGIVGLALLALVIERLKKRGSKFAARVSAAHFVAGILGFLLIAVIQHHTGYVSELEEELDVLRYDAASVGVPDAVPGGDEFGPVPRRPQHPPRLGGTYFRGNDERDGRLYNGGFYRTATLMVELIDAAGSVLEVGARPSGDLSLRVSIRRAKGTTNAHFTERAIKSIFLSRQSPLTSIEDVPVPVAVIEPEWLWQATYSLGEPVDNELRGRLFLFSSSTLRDNKLTGRPHYGIEFSVQLKDGVIVEPSEVWMGSLFQTPKVRQTPPGMIPATEWFDFRPMPEIEGENTTDPKLLGIEHPDG